MQNINNYRKTAVFGLVLTSALFGLFFSISGAVAAVDNHDPRGYLDAADCTSVRGWATDDDTSGSFIGVAIWVDGHPGQSGKSETERVSANLYRQDLKSAGIGDHAFSWPIPSQFRDGKTHTVYAYGIDSSGKGVNTHLSGSPKTFSGCQGGGSNSNTSGSGQDYSTGSTTWVSGNPRIDSFSPTSGNQGTNVTIRGEYFASGLTVTFDGVSAQITSVNSNEIRVVAPNHSAGSATIKVTNPDGVYATFNSYRFSYQTSGGGGSSSQTQYGNPSVPTLNDPVRVTVGDSTPLLRWSVANSNDVASFWVEVDNNSNFGSPEYMVKFIQPFVTETSFLSDGTYYWHVRAFGKNGSWSKWSDREWFEVDADGGSSSSQAASTPSLQFPSNSSSVGNSSVTLGWQSASNATRYWLEVDNNSGFGSPEFQDQNISSSQLSRTVSLADGFYYWRVRAMGSDNNWSTWSAVWNFTVNTGGTIVQPGSMARFGNLFVSSSSINSGGNVHFSTSGQSNISRFTVQFNCPAGVIGWSTAPTASHVACGGPFNLFFSQVNLPMIFTNSNSNSQNVTATFVAYNHQGVQGETRTVNFNVQGSGSTTTTTTTTVVDNSGFISSQLAVLQARLLALQAELLGLNVDGEVVVEENGGGNGFLAYLLTGLRGLDNDPVLKAFVIVLGLLLIIVLIYILWLLLSPYYYKKENK